MPALTWDNLIITPFVNILMAIYYFIGQNFGISIILFTVLIRLLTQPLTTKQIKSSQAMMNLQKDPEWIEAQKKYKNDREKLAQEQMNVYKKKGISPFPPASRLSFNCQSSLRFIKRCGRQWLATLLICTHYPDTFGLRSAFKVSSLSLFWH